MKLPYRARQLEYVRLILEHPIFHDLFEAALQIGDVPDKEYVAKKMREYQVCGENLIVREVKFSAGMAVLDSDAGERRIGNGGIIICIRYHAKG